MTVDKQYWFGFPIILLVAELLSCRWRTLVKICRKLWFWFFCPAPVKSRECLPILRQNRQLTLILLYLPCRRFRENGVWSFALSCTKHFACVRFLIPAVWWINMQRILR